MPVTDRAWLLRVLPHQGRMNLLDAVVRWDEARVHAIAHGHRAADHPLRRAGVLPITAAIEYGAQAAAAHGALIAQQASAGGYLASMRAVRFGASRLDDVAGALDVYAEHLGGGEGGVLYRFEVRGADMALAEGRLTVAFGPGIASPRQRTTG